MMIELSTETAALLARLAAVRQCPADDALANTTLAAALREILPVAERAAIARRIAAQHRTEVWHG